MKKCRILYFILVGILSLNSYSQTRIIFDTDIGGDADDLGALAMLHHFVDSKECELVAVMCWSTEQYAVSAIDAVNRYYGHPEIPVGARKDSIVYIESNYNKVIADQFPHELKYDDVPDAVALYRKLLAESDDKSLVIVTVGPLKNIEDVLKSEGDAVSPLSGKDLIEQKVKEFVIMGGVFPEGKWEWNFAGGMPGVTQYVLSNLEVPITFTGFELGVQVKTGETFNRIDQNTPLYVGFLHFSKNAPWIKGDFKGEILDNSTFDQTAVLYAVRNGSGLYWDKVSGGICVPDEKGGNTWQEQKDSMHSYLQLRMDPEALAEIIEQLMLGSSLSETEGADLFAQQALWSRSDNSYNNFRIPSLIVTKKGTVLAFAEGREGGDSGNIDILLKRSEDGGRTWSKQLVVWDDGANTCGNPCPLVDHTSGRIILLMTWNLGSDSEDRIIRKKSKDTRKPYICYSDDDGLTWTAPEDLSSSSKNPSWGWYATGPGVGVQLKSEKYRNRLIIPANHSYDVQIESEAVRGGYGYGSHVIYSDDGGLSWTLSEKITPGCNESQLVELSNGDLMMNMRSYNKKGCRAISLSQDGGTTWSDIKHDPQLVESVCQASLIEFGAYRGKPGYLFSNPAVTEGRSHMTIKASQDDCQTWSKGILVHEGPSAYSCLTVLPDGSIGLLYEAGEKDPYEFLLFQSFKADELFRK